MPFTVLHAAAKSRHAERAILDDGKTHLKLLDALKNEYKVNNAF